MAQQNISLGTAGTNSGDTIRDAFDKCNDNFNDCYKKADAGYLLDPQQILITPGDFVPNGDNSYYNVALNGYGGYAIVKSSALEMVATFVIPKGMKATAFRINCSHTVTTRIYECRITTASATQKGTGNTNVEINSTDFTADGTNYISIYVGTTSTAHQVYGGYIKLGN
jgi:hypothetical protein